MLADGARRWCVCVCVCVKGREERRIDGMHVRRAWGQWMGGILCRARPSKAARRGQVAGSESEIREVTEW